MKISVLMENLPFAEGYRSEFGLSMHVETASHRLLFDMGESDAFLENAEKMGVDIAAVDTAVLSHGHYDHGGGLDAFLRVNSRAPVYVSQYAFDPSFQGREEYIGIRPELAGHPRIRPVGEQLRLDETLELFACNANPRPFPTESYGLNTLRANRLIPEDFRHEQYLLIREGEKRVLLSGCSHKGVLNIAGWLAPDVMIGGFHLMEVDPAGDGRGVLDQTARELLSCPTRYYTCHCTGVAQYRYLKASMGERIAYLAAGQQLEL